MFDHIEKHRDIIKMASSPMDTGYAIEGYSTTTPNGNNAVVSTIIDTHDEYEKNITIKIEDYHDYDEYYINYEDVYNAFKNNTVKLSENDPIYKVCSSDNSTNHNILRDELMMYIAKCLNINENLTMSIVCNFSGTSTDMKIRAFSTMIQLVEKNQKVVDRDNLLEDSINAMNDYIQSLDN